MKMVKAIPPLNNIEIFNTNCIKTIRTKMMVISSWLIFYAYSLLRTFKMKFTNFIFIVVVFYALNTGGAPSKKYKKVFRSGSDCDCVCGVSNRQMRVVGGNETKVHEFPWIAGLGTGGVFHCGATLITRRHLLTAAHCVNGFSTKELTVVLADHDRESQDRFSSIVVRGLRKVKEHEAFDVSSFNNDIAILELDQPVDFDVTVQAACLPTSGIVDYSGRIGIVAGWGKLGENKDISPVLRKVAVPVWSKEQCYNSDYGELKISENMICAGYPEGNKDACRGDSGGPLHVAANGGNMEVIGLVSWGRGCARPNLPGIYTKIGNYLEWIHDALEGECLCKPQNGKSRRV